MPVCAMTMGNGVDGERSKQQVRKEVSSRASRLAEVLLLEGGKERVAAR